MIEEVKEFKYLGYMFQRNRKQEVQVKDEKGGCSNGTGMGN